ncbi:MAG: hypothetical protein EGQ57_00250, partial [Alphaproteobacteria bacterium]|nr:hypothetical protein [Alphaproteobacteria bacterium]
HKYCFTTQARLITADKPKTYIQLQKLPRIIKQMLMITTIVVTYFRKKVNTDSPGIDNFVKFI